MNNRTLLWTGVFLTGVTNLVAQPHRSHSLSSVQPYGLADKVITSLAAETQESKGFFILPQPLASGTAGEGVFLISPFDSTPLWQSFGLPGRTVTALTIQHWGAGPLDGQRLVAAVVPDPAHGDSTLVFEREVRFADDSAWTSADSGIDRRSGGRIRAFSSYYFTGHAPRQPILSGGEAGLMYRFIVWHQASPIHDVVVNTIDVAPHWFGNLAWAAGRLGLSPAAFRSTDQGMTWTTQFLPSMIEGEARAVAINPRNHDSVYVSLNGALWLTGDSGATWSSSGLFVPGGTITSLGIDPLRPENIFAAGMNADSSFAFFHSSDGGHVWRDVQPSSDVIPAGVSSLAVLLDAREGRANQTQVFIGTLGSGVWVYTPEIPTGAVPAPQRPVRFSLDQNYPNPFNPSTVIRYTLPVRARVLLKIYDVLGREVRRLVDAEQEPGTKTVQWIGSGDDGRSIPGGVYFYRLQAGQFISAGRMLLLK